jgi:hypothetical protein
MSLYNILYFVFNIKTPIQLASLNITYRKLDNPFSTLNQLKYLNTIYAIKT